MSSGKNRLVKINEVKDFEYKIRKIINKIDLINLLMIRERLKRHTIMFNFPLHLQ